MGLSAGPRRSAQKIGILADVCTGRVKPPLLGLDAGKNPSFHHARKHVSHERCIPKRTAAKQNSSAYKGRLWKSFQELLKFKERHADLAIFNGLHCLHQPCYRMRGLALRKLESNLLACRWSGSLQGSVVRLRRGHGLDIGGRK